MKDVVLEAPPILNCFSLEGRTALVTGAGQGIGRAFAHALGEAGAKVAIVDIALPLAEEVAGELTGKGFDAIAVKADVTRPDDVAAAVKTTVESMGQPDHRGQQRGSRPMGRL